MFFVGNFKSSSNLLNSLSMKELVQQHMHNAPRPQYYLTAEFIYTFKEMIDVLVDNAHNDITSILVYI